MSSLIEPGKPALPPAPDRSSAEREQARKRLEKKNKLRGDLVAYVVINLALIGVWAITGRGYFWPGWVLGAWGAFLLLDAWNAYFRRPVTEADIDRELRRQR
jgi:2TM domain